MANSKREFFPNQVFVGLPWKITRPKYERCIQKLGKKYPLYFVIVGRDDGQDARDLFELIKQRIASSSYAVFDATGGNANVSLEYGYAEGIEVPKAIFLNDHKSSQKSTAGTPIISDLMGQKRVPYKNETALFAELNKVCQNHDFTKRFEKALVSAVKGQTKGAKKRNRALALDVSGP